MRKLGISGKGFPLTDFPWNLRICTTGALIRTLFVELSRVLNHLLDRILTTKDHNDMKFDRVSEPYDEMSFCDWNIKCKTTVLIKENEKLQVKYILVLCWFQ